MSILTCCFNSSPSESSADLKDKKEQTPEKVSSPLGTAAASPPVEIYVDPKDPLELEQKVKESVSITEEIFDTEPIKRNNIPEVAEEKKLVQDIPEVLVAPDISASEEQQQKTVVQLQENNGHSSMMNNIPSIIEEIDNTKRAMKSNNLKKNAKKKLRRKNRRQEKNRQVNA